jgi:hypothetical protein
VIIQSAGYGISRSSLQVPFQNLALSILKNKFGFRYYNNYIFYFDYDKNHRNPNQGTPNSTGKIYYPDGSPKQEREYGNDGRPTVDHDHHLGEGVGYDHDHDWDHDKTPPRQPAREPGKIVALLGAIGVGILIVVLAADDLTGVGVSDDVFIPAAVASFASFIIILFRSESVTGDDN